MILDTGQRRVWRGDEEIELSKLSFDFLEALVEAAPNLLKHDQLAAAVWGPRRVASVVHVVFNWPAALAAPAATATPLH